ncbi:MULTISPECIES: N-6 DNA methylase [unclassified Polynucleobacter]|jgi:type I restriction-modification system DNA methylase subunit|uniref:HsdM family class I SAM-dependent methyltransferase n=1 Tax=unclassified Polynucleobacter TaxID=2640945 RepID=UPI0008CF1391|nr:MULTISPECIES: N-6 DNA methylase [unclassified Polynucleobacter]OHC10119.1 MAG: restriction endonuclease [Polynucleobacter sp. GWA2_45_21]HBK43611.1 SAM-dependent methyltransferase [Polynucleobacter sp.]
MAKKEAVTDLWVHGLLQKAGVNLEPQGSTIFEINEALKSASKSGSGKVGFPEYVGVIKDFLLVIENKPEISKHSKITESGVISNESKDVKNYAVNGALFYGKHLAKNTSYKKVIAFGISGDQKKHRISPIYIDETEYYRELPDVESFISFTDKNIEEYYVREILKEETDTQKELSEILKDAAALHEDLRNYGNLKDIDKPLIVSGILLALREAESRNFSIEELTGDDVSTDGQKIYGAIQSNLTRSKVAPEVKKDKILSQFSIFKDSVRLNEVNKTLGKTPLKHFAEFLNDRIYKSIKYSSTSEDYLGRFYGEFMSYSGGDGQTLGIVLTPKHITDLFCDLVDIKFDDVVLDPCAGTAGFLVAAMHHMLAKTESEVEKKKIRQERLHGIEDQEYMFTIATTNMILRGDGKSNLINGDFLKENPSKIQLKQASVGMMNPPYSQGSKSNPSLYEISFTEHLLDSMTAGGRVIVIIPQSSVTGKTNEEQAIKSNILKKHTLEGVITLNKDTFYGVGTMPCIAIFTAGERHPVDRLCKFIDFRSDGYKVSPHIGLIETEQAKDRKQHLLDVWFNRIEADSRFCVNTTVEPDDEWLHSFYYFNDDVPTDDEFERTIGDYLSFEFSMIMQNRGYLFDLPESKKEKE